MVKQLPKAAGGEVDTLAVLSDGGEEEICS